MTCRIIPAFFLLTSCSMAELVDQPEARTKSDTVAYIPRPRDTVSVSEVPIGFEVGVDEWEDEDIDINL